MDKTTQTELKPQPYTTNIIKDSFNDNIIESKYGIKADDKLKEKITNKINNYVPYGKE